MHPVDVGGDLTIPLQTAAIAMLPGMRGREADRAAARDADQAGPASGRAGRHSPHAPAAWPAAQIQPVAREVLRDLAAIPAAQRIGPAVAETFAFGRELVARLPEGRIGGR